MIEMKIVADTNIPFLKGVMEPYAQVLYLDAKDIDRQVLMDADALIIRTRTKCNREMLEGTMVKMIASATIGTDHIDLAWCKENGIEVQNAEGCNAGGVADYVFSALYGVASRRAIKLDDAVIGIIGVGNVGKKVEQMARSLGFKVLLNDPPRAQAEGQESFVSLDELLTRSTIVTLHVPLDDTTREMANDAFFEKMRPGAIFINASRGEVVDETALLRSRPKLGALILDTWCNEPTPNPILIEACDVATPHIAGYSYQGKQNGTAMAVQAVARHFGIEPLYNFHPTWATNLRARLPPCCNTTIPSSRTISFSAAPPPTSRNCAANTITAGNFILINHITLCLTRKTSNKLPIAAPQSSRWRSKLIISRMASPG